MNKPCLDCGTVTPNTRCRPCAGAIASRLVAIPRMGTAARGYDARWKAIRLAVLDRDDWACQQCGKQLQGSDATVDHVVPLAADRSLRLDASNLRALCRSCNSAKGARPR